MKFENINKYLVGPFVYKYTHKCLSASIYEFFESVQQG